MRGDDGFALLLCGFSVVIGMKLRQREIMYMENHYILTTRETYNERGARIRKEA